MSEQIWSETRGKQFKGHLAATRHVDDLVVLSPDTCRGCVNNLLKSVYPAGVEFEAQSGCEWLDMSLRIDAEGELVISAKQTESDWVYGRADKSGKHVIPPYLGDPSVDTRRMWCQVKGRAARLRQLKLRPAELYAAVNFHIATWRRAGWPYRHIRTWWCYLCRYPDISLVARRVLNGLGQYPVGKEPRGSCQ